MLRHSRLGVKGNTGIFVNYNFIQRIPLFDAYISCGCPPAFLSLVSLCFQRCFKTKKFSVLTVKSSFLSQLNIASFLISYVFNVKYTIMNIACLYHTIYVRNYVTDILNILSIHTCFMIFLNC